LLHEAILSYGYDCVDADNDASASAVVAVADADANAASKSKKNNLNINKDTVDTILETAPAYYVGVR
jgi:hypothetical protein